MPIAFGAPVLVTDEGSDGDEVMNDGLVGWQRSSVGSRSLRDIPSGEGCGRTRQKWPRVSYGNASSSAGELHEACWNATHSTTPLFPAAAAPARHIVDHVPYHVGDVCRDVTLNDIGNPVAVLIFEARLARTLLVTSHGQSSDFVSVNTCKPSSCCCPLCSSATLPPSSVVEGLLSNLVYAPRK